MAIRQPSRQGTPEHDGFTAAAGQVLARMDQLITEIKQQRLDQAGSEKVRQAEKASQDSNTLVSVLEEQFRAMETWLLPMTHGDKAERDRVIDQLRERFEIMVRGYNRLIEVLQSRRAEKEGHAGAPEPPIPGPQARKPRRRRNIECLHRTGTSEFAATPCAVIFHAPVSIPQAQDTPVRARYKREWLRRLTRTVSAITLHPSDDFD